MDVCTVRDPYDAIESWMDVFGFDLETSLLDFENWAVSFHSLRTYALVINFKEIESRPIIVIWKIAKHLGIRLTLFELATLYNRIKKDSVKTFSQKIQPDNKGVLDIGFSYFDKKTFFIEGMLERENY